MEDLMLARACDCGQEVTRRALVSTIPGSADGRLVWLYLCEACYEREGWAEVDLSAERDMHELASQGLAGSDAR